MLLFYYLLVIYGIVKAYHCNVVPTANVIQIINHNIIVAFKYMNDLLLNYAA